MRKLKSLTLLFLIATCGSLMAQEITRDYEKEAQNHISTIYQLLDRQTELPFDDFLISEMSKLNELKPNIENEKVLAQIQRVIDDYYDKMSELKEQAAAQAKAKEDAAKAEAQAQAEQEAQKAAQAEKDRKAEEEAKAAEAKKSRNTMIIIGVILAVALFGANQLIQHLRNMKTQRSIMEMQKNATNPTSNPIEKKVEGGIRREMSKAAGRARQQGKNAARKAAGKLGNPKGNNKRISI